MLYFYTIVSFTHAFHLLSPLLLSDIFTIYDYIFYVLQDCFLTTELYQISFCRILQESVFVLQVRCSFSSRLLRYYCQSNDPVQSFNFRTLIPLLSLLFLPHS